MRTPGLFIEIFSLRFSGNQRGNQGNARIRVGFPIDIFATELISMDAGFYVTGIKMIQLVQLSVIGAISHRPTTPLIGY